MTKPLCVSTMRGKRGEARRQDQKRRGIDYWDEIPTNPQTNNSSAELPLAGACLPVPDGAEAPPGWHGG